MTEEQIKQNAADYVYNFQPTGVITEDRLKCYIAGAHSLNEEIYDLKRDIEDLQKMVKMRSDAFEYARKEIDRLSSPWISVEERLPTNQKQKVIMRKRTGQYYCGWFDTSLNCFLTIDPSGTKWTINGVTHWMPRPELKKGDKI